jgi:hypothetical protein
LLRCAVWAYQVDLLVRWRAWGFPRVSLGLWRVTEESLDCLRVEGRLRDRDAFLFLFAGIEVVFVMVEKVGVLVVMGVRVEGLATKRR